MVAIIKKAKGTKKCVIKQNLCLKISNIACLTIKRYIDGIRFRSYYHFMYTEEVNKIALSSNDDKRLQTSDKIKTYRYGTDETMIKQS